MAVDQDRLNEFLGRFVADLGATITAGGIVVGHRLGLYRGLATGPATPDELAARTATTPRYVAEWLRAQAAGGYVEHDAATGVFSMTEEQAFALTDPDGPVSVPGAFVRALGALRAESQITDAFRTGAGMGWHEHHDDVPVGCEMNVRPGYLADLVSSWIPALHGVAAKLAAGRAGGRRGLRARRVHGAAGPGLPELAVRRLGLPPRVDRARPQARPDAGVASRATFEVATAQDFPGTGYDLVATFDALHDRGDPVGAARHVREAIADDGTWLIVEPYTGDAVAHNLTLVGRVHSGFSTSLCVPERAVPARRARPGRPGRRGRDPGDRHQHRVLPVPPRGRDTVQHRPGSPAMKVSLSGNLGRYVDFDCEIDLDEGPDQRRGVGRRLPGRHARGPEMAGPICGNGSGSAPSGLDRAITRTPDTPRRSWPAGSTSSGPASRPASTQ